MDHQSAAWKALQAYLDGINQYQDSHASPMEFDVLGIPKRPFTAEDTISVAGYLAYSFAAAFRTEPLLTYVRDQLGADYLKIFDLDWQPEGALNLAASRLETLDALAPSANRHWPTTACRSSKAATPGPSAAAAPERQAVAGGRPAYPLFGAIGVVRGATVGAGL
jgi:acyl-homoserine lactone acylase PvdQ